MKKGLLILLVLAPLFFACAKKNEEGVSVGNGKSTNDGPSLTNSINDGPYLTMQADLSDAAALTTNALKKTGARDTKQLLKINGEGKVSVVLQGEHQLQSFKLTPNYIVARVDISEGPARCSLIAIPRIRGTTKVRCLNRELVRCKRDNTDATNDAFDTIGDEVFFAHQKAENNYGICNEGNETGNYASFSELRWWNGRTDSVQTIFHSDPAEIGSIQPAVLDVFAAKNGNVCLSAANGSLLCRKRGEENWFLPKGDYRRARFLKQGENLLTEGTGAKSEIISLTSASVGLAKREGDLPFVIHFRRENGGILGERWGKLIFVKPNGDSEELSEIPQGSRPARVANFAWYFQPLRLFRVDLDTGKVEDKNYLGDSALVTVTSVAWASGDRLRVDGIGQKGSPSSSLLTENGRLFSNETPSIPIEHPIELTWK